MGLDEGHSDLQRDEPAAQLLSRRAGSDIPFATPFAHALAELRMREGGLDGADAAGDRGALALLRVGSAAARVADPVGRERAVLRRTRGE